jgi:hypothetical protein
MMSEPIALNFKTSMPNDDDLKLLDRIAAGSGDVSAADIREVARIVAVVAREANATIGLLQRMASLGAIHIS